MIDLKKRLFLSSVNLLMQMQGFDKSPPLWLGPLSHDHDPAMASVATGLRLGDFLMEVPFAKCKNENGQVALSKMKFQDLKL